MLGVIGQPKSHTEGARVLLLLQRSENAVTVLRCTPQGQLGACIITLFISTRVGSSRNAVTPISKQGKQGWHEPCLGDSAPMTTSQAPCPCLGTLIFPLADAPSAVGRRGHLLDWSQRQVQKEEETSGLLHFIDWIC